MSFGTPPSPAPVVLPSAPSPPPMFGSLSGPGQKPQAKPSQPTFLGGLAAGPGNLGYRTLLGGGS
jgi:hypothetical protein